MTWREWFGTIDADAMTGSQEAFLYELGGMLATYRPAELDPAASSVRSHGHGWTMKDAIEVRLVHRIDPDASIEIAIGRDEAMVAWLTWHEHVDPEKGHEDERAWTSRLVDAVAGALRGDYELVETYRGDKVVKTTIIDLEDPDQPRRMGTVGSLLFWVPRRRPTRTVTRRVSYGVQRTAAAGQDPDPISSPGPTAGS